MPAGDDDTGGKKSATPERSLVQRMEALQRANDTRVGRARLKRRIRAGEAWPEDLLREPPALLETMKVWDLLIATPKWGRVKVNRTLGQCKISPSKTVGGLSERQRRELAAILERRTARSVTRPLITHPTTLL